MRSLYLLALAVLFSFCSKDKIDSKLVEVQYVINSTTDKPFHSIYYEETDQATGNVVTKSDWSVFGKGRFIKVARIEDGRGAGLSVESSYSGDWTISLYQDSEFR